MARGNPENLRAAAQRKHQAATERAQTALDALDRRRRAGHLPRPREDGGRVDRLPIPLAAARPRRAAPRRTATHAARPRATATPSSTSRRRRATSCARSPRKSPSSSSATAPRPSSCGPRSPPPTARTSNCDASSAANTGRRPPDPGTVYDPPPAVPATSEQQQLLRAHAAAPRSPRRASCGPRATPRGHTPSRRARTRSNTSRGPPPDTRASWGAGRHGTSSAACPTVRPAAQSAARSTPGRHQQQRIRRNTIP